MSKSLKALTVVMVFALSATLLTNPPSATAAPDSPMVSQLLTQPLGSACGGGSCDDNCGFGDHSVPNGWDTYTYIGSHTDSHGCQSGSCSDYHKPCGVTAIELDEAWMEFGQVASAEIFSFANQHEETVRLTEGGEAIQFIDCQGTIVAHIPLGNLAAD